MNFSRGTSHFFKTRTIKNFCQNKYSCSFFSSNLNKISSRNFITFSNLFYLSSIQKMVLASRSLGMQVSSMINGNSAQSGENALESSIINIDQLASGTLNLSDMVLWRKVNFLN